MGRYWIRHHHMCHFAVPDTMLQLIVRDKLITWILLRGCYMPAMFCPGNTGGGVWKVPGGVKTDYKTMCNLLSHCCKKHALFLYTCTHTYRCTHMDACVVAHTHAFRHRCAHTDTHRCTLCTHGLHTHASIPHACMHRCTHVHVHIDTTQTHACMSAHTGMHTLASTSMHTNAYTHGCTHGCAHIDMHT